MLSKLLIEKTKPGTLRTRLWDSRGLYLEISPKGGKWWRFKYSFGGKERRISLGVYPDVSLAEARDRREAARKLLAAGIDPADQRKAEKAADDVNPGVSFEVIAREWFEMFSKEWVPNHANKIKGRLDNYILPYIGARPIKSITAPELLAVVRRSESRGKRETAHRVLQVCGRVFRLPLRPAGLSVTHLETWAAHWRPSKLSILPRSRTRGRWGRS